MKFNNAIPFLALAIGVVAEPTPTSNQKASLVQRDLSAVTQVISKINSGVADLDTAIKSFSGDSSDLLSKSQSLIATVKSGTSTVESMSELTLLDAAQVAGTVQTLQTAINGVVSDIIAKKSDIVAAGAGPDVYKTLQAQKAASEGLAAAITSKVPDQLKETATGLSSGVASSLSRAVAAYEGVSAGSSSGSSSSPSSGSGSSSGSSSGGVKPAAAASSAAHAPTGIVTKPSVTSAGVKPAMYTGAAASNNFGSSVAALAAVAAAIAL